MAALGTHAQIGCIPREQYQCCLVVLPHGDGRSSWAVRQRCATRPTKPTAPLFARLFRGFWINPMSWGFRAVTTNEFLRSRWDFTAVNGMRAGDVSGWRWRSG